MAEAEMSETQIRAYWTQQAESVQNDENVADFLALLRVVDTSSFQIALPTLCIVAANEISEARKLEFELICSDVLLDAESTRPSRRAALACLKEFRSAGAWIDFYTLVEALEEPQFHIIQPILPRFDSLIESVRDQKLEFLWAKVALFRAIVHTNGWIRTWAIEKSVQIEPAILEKNHEFLTSIVIPHLNNNDVFWRHLEKSRMDEFLSTLSALFESIKSTPSFLRQLLASIENLSCPTAIYFVVSTLSHVTCAEILNAEDVALMRRVVLRARYIPHKSMRIVTIRNLILFYARVTKLNPTVLEELANLIAYISHEATPSLIDYIYLKIEQIIVKTAYSSGEEQLPTFESKQLAEHARMWWSSMAGEPEKQEIMMARLQLDVSESLAESGKDLTIQLFLLKETPGKQTPSVLSLLKNELGEYVLTRVISNQGTRHEFQMLNSLYIPLFVKHCEHMLLPSAVAISKVLIDSLSKGRISESVALLLTFFDAILEAIGTKESESVSEIREDYFEYLGGKEVIGMRRQKKTVEEYDTKQFNQIIATLHSLRIKLLDRFTTSVSDPNAFLLECVEQLDVASAFSVKQQICRLISRFIPFSDSQVAVQCIRAAANIVNEEKKSLNSLPALEAFAEVALSARLQKDKQMALEVIEMLDQQMSIASQSTPVALILVDALAKYRKNLDVDWAAFIVKLALFGPVPKKESRVISHAYQMMFREEEGLLKQDQLERLDEVVQKTRFKAVTLSIELAKSGTWQRSLIQELVEASAIMDQSSSRSFGLSMAHRQKTRAVELLHLLADRVDDQEFALEIFDFCISCVVDPCQQFSIKLIVEWTLARLCIKFIELFEKITDKDFETKMASQRIGSMCSWLNVLMLISRAAPNLTETCLDKVIVWCTAQNFPVRCTALAAARLMFATFDKEKRKKWRLVKAIVNFDAEPSGNSRRVIENLCGDFYFAHLHVEKHFDFQTVLTEIAKRTGMPPEETIPLETIEELYSESCEVKASNTDERFLKAPSDVYSALSKNASCAPTMESAVEVVDDVDGLEVENLENTPASFQRKIVKDCVSKDEEISLIVVASLVDKPNNLGGICRTSEIFGVDVLVVADILVAQDSNFRALSMSSESWQKIEAVKPANLLPYLQNLRAQGYTVIAAEQTTDSVMMHDFVFPKKAVIVMGDEKEGVPVNLLRAVDQTVEIKQVGHTRSLNVHVTAALMIAKFAEQVRFAKS